MRWTKLPLLILVLAFGCRRTALPHPQFSTVVAYGDSITRGFGVPEGAGWVDRLAARYAPTAGQPGIKFINAGGNANTSAEGLARFATDVRPHLPALVLVEFGGNDVVEGKRHVSVDDFERNLATIHRAVTAGGGAVILITFPPIINEWHAFGRDPYFVARGGLDRDVDHYRERTRLVAQRLGVPLFDLDQLLRARMNEKGPKSCIAPDGVHLTPEGHALVSEAMQAFLVGQGWIPR